MADSVCEMLNWEPDIPENHSDGRLPMLDLKLYTCETGPFLRHSFYKKEVSSRYLIPYNSALPENVKRPILIQEGLRRVRNISPSNPLEETQEVLKDFNVDMM